MCINNRGDTVIQYAKAAVKQLFIRYSYPSWNIQLFARQGGQRPLRNGLVLLWILLHVINSNIGQASFCKRSHDGWHGDEERRHTVKRVCYQHVSSYGMCMQMKHTYWLQWCLIDVRMGGKHIPNWLKLINLDRLLLLPCVHVIYFICSCCDMYTML